MYRTAAALAVSALLVAPPALAAGASKEIRVELSAPAGAPYVVENLAGSMRVTRGSGNRVVAVATVHAESEALLREFRFEQVAGEKGVATLRAIYPASHATFRLPKDKEQEGSSWLGRLFNWGNNTTVEYAGRRVKISDSGGVLLYADIEVTVPARAGTATFRNLVGALSGSGISGKLLFDVASADIGLEDLGGEITADAGSGNITAERISGDFVGDAGSGNITVTGFDGEKLSLDVGSGNLTGSDVKARAIVADTGSGNIRISAAHADSFRADTGSGNVLLEADGSELGTVDVDTGSGNVTLRLGDSASFEARAARGSGALTSAYDDADPIRDGPDIVGYRRGDGRTRIRVETGSGNVRIEPGRKGV